MVGARTGAWAPVSLSMTVWDSGAGVNRPANGSGGLGLRNIRERLASYYGEAARFTLDKNGKTGTEAAINLPVKVEGPERE